MKRRKMRTCPMCGCKLERDESFRQHCDYTHSNDVDALAYHLQREIEQRLNRRTQK